ncbi:hypothetical protein K502DRAFT_354066 [Neoconidiobolus thromboides FSU 785]|nr:hypothetical protein K502DRAFT_354066 [Neoconidiobolus thromboides FSU 785]
MKFTLLILSTLNFVISVPVLDGLFSPFSNESNPVTLSIIRDRDNTRTVRPAVIEEIEEVEETNGSFRRPPGMRGSQFFNENRIKDRRPAGIEEEIEETEEINSNFQPSDRRGSTRFNGFNNF